MDQTEKKGIVKLISLGYSVDSIKSHMQRVHKIW